MYGKLLRYFDTFVGVNPVVTRLHAAMQSSWRDKATSYKRLYSVAYPVFSYFVDFIADRASLYNDPGFNFESDQYNTVVTSQSHYKSDKPKSDKPNFRVHVHKTNIRQENLEKQSIQKPKIKCATYKMNHSLGRCVTFKGMSITDKLKLLKDNGICSSVLIPMLILARTVRVIKGTKVIAVIKRM